MKNLSSIIATSNNKNGSTPNNADYCLAIEIVKGYKGYTNYGGSKYGASKERNPERYLNAWGVDFQKGNDAPRGGKTGNYIELSQKGMIQTKVYRAEVALELAKAKADRLAELEIVNQKLIVSKNQIIENIKNNKDYFDNTKAELAELKSNGNKDEWHVKANAMVQTACQNDFSIGWSNIYKLIQNN